MGMWVRQTGSQSGKTSINLLQDFSSFPIALPSSTSSSSSTKRTFAKNSLVEHIASSNDYNASYGKINSRAGDSINISFYGGYSVGIVTSCEHGKDYIFKYNSGRPVVALYYRADGTHLTSANVSNSVPFRVPSDAEFTILLLGSESSSESYTFTPISLEEYSDGSIVPWLLGNTDTIGHTVTSSSKYSTSYEPYRAFAGLTNQDGWISSGTTNQWIQIQLPNAKICKRMKITNGNTYGTSVPSRMVLKGSNDGVSFYDIQSLVNTNNIKNATHWYDIDNDTAYSIYRLFVVDCIAGSSFVNIGALQLFTKQGGILNVICIQIS